MTYEPFLLFGEDRRSRWLITVDHATNTVPSEVNAGDLGLPPDDMERHIAYDIGAKGVALHLGDLLGAPVVCSNFSRLVIDPNRGVTDPTLIMRLYDGTIVPANATIDDAEEQRRKDTYYHPYHNAIETQAALQEDVIIVAMHSFSPKLNGRAPRPWEVGILHADHDQRDLGPFVIKQLEALNGLTVGDNEPYAGHLPGDAVDQHALQKDRVNCLIEVRQDLIKTEEGQRDWAETLAPVLTEALASSGF